MSYSEFTLKVIRTLKSVPEGKVITYGDLAALAGSPRGARQVVRILNAMSKSHLLPWHRVIGAGGKILLQGEGAVQQEALLEAEGVEVIAGRVDMGRYAWTGVRLD